MNDLAARIVRLIEAQGPLSIAQFMTITLHDRAAGYYATREPFGAEGDFITAPDISQMFGELIGLWCAQAWLDQGRPQGPKLVELGPGRGTLMADALRAAKNVPGFLSGADIVLVESSPRLRALQKERLKDAGVPVMWTERFEGCDRPLFLIANEFFDALPVRQFVRTERGWCERMIVVDENGALALALAPTATLVRIEGNAPQGALFEIAPAADAIAEEIGRTIASEGGAALIIDYGYEGPAFGDTLQAVSRQRYADILDAPGTLDISAHVDFARLASAAARGGAVTCGPVDQGAFLTRLGIEVRAERLARENPNEAAPIRAAAERLTEEAQMGRLFQALAILPAGAPKPAGF